MLIIIVAAIIASDCIWYQADRLYIRWLTLRKIFVLCIQPCTTTAFPSASQVLRSVWNHSLQPGSSCQGVSLAPDRLLQSQVSALWLTQSNQIQTVQIWFVLSFFFFFSFKKESSCTETEHGMRNWVLNLQSCLHRWGLVPGHSLVAFQVPNALSSRRTKMHNSFNIRCVLHLLLIWEWVVSHCWEVFAMKNTMDSSGSNWIEMSELFWTQSAEQTM